MDFELDEAPCGYLSLDDKGKIISINQTLLTLVGFARDELVGEHINLILPISSRAFYQIYFFPMIKVQKKIEEMYIVLRTKEGVEIPVLLNAKRNKREQAFQNDCVFIPMHKRNEFEKELIYARKEAERLLAKNQQYHLKISKELELAQSIQAATIPEIFEAAQFQFVPFYRPSAELSGDIYGFFPIWEDKFALIIVDVMGHGISSALITMYLRAAYQSYILRGDSVSSVVAKLDHILHTLFEGQYGVRHYASLIYLEIDLNAKKIEYINAGHPPALLQMGSEMQTLDSTVLPIGLIEGLNFHSEVVPLKPRGRILLYTDGVSDYCHPTELQRIFEFGQQESLVEIKQHIIVELDKVEDRADDQCFILIEWNEKSEATSDASS